MLEWALCKEILNQITLTDYHSMAPFFFSHMYQDCEDTQFAVFILITDTEKVDCHSKSIVCILIYATR